MLKLNPSDVQVKKMDCKWFVLFDLQNEGEPFSFGSFYTSQLEAYQTDGTDSQQIVLNRNRLGPITREPVALPALPLPQPLYINPPSSPTS
ncbi:hypothetical protein TNCV_4879711 [Trichonephila clavipes]|nr:hypothetical protein TNCV_4879711 [Trichonephila clavipes]